MKISVFGLGYVGCVSAACLAHDGHIVIGVDVDRRKVEAVAAGNAPFYEPGLGELLKEANKKGTLTATSDENHAILASDMAIICVGTPSDRDGNIQLDYLRAVLTSIGKAVRDRNDPFLVVLRSTVLPQFVEEQLLPLLIAASGRELSENLQFCYNPEFLREGSAIRDYYRAPIIVIGHRDDRAAALLARIYQKVEAQVVFTDIATACLIKYVCNVFHALKVAFANEVGYLSQAMNVDGRRLMEIVCQDTKLNISPAYLAPGFAFGGSCLPKDLRGVVADSRRRALTLPVIQSILASNKNHLDTCIEVVLGTGRKKVGMFGLTFKEGTDDLRESPAVELAEALIGKGRELSIYEPAISQGCIHGANLHFIERNIPHIWKLLALHLETMLENCGVIVLLKKPSEDERSAFNNLRADQICVDFVGALGTGEVRAQVLSFGLPQPFFRGTAAAAD